MIYDWLKNIDFAYPWVFGLFGLLPLVILWYGKRNNRQQPTITVSSIFPFAVFFLENKVSPPAFYPSIARTRLPDRGASPSSATE